MTQQQVTGTDEFYTDLDVGTRIVVQQRTSEIRTLMRRTAQDIIEIGQKLIEVKERLAHGKFDVWLRVEFAWSLQTAKRSMNVAQRFQNQQFADFDMAPSALYLLAAPSAPESAREEALLRAEGCPGPITRVRGARRGGDQHIASYQHNLPFPRA